MHLPTFDKQNKQHKKQMTGKSAARLSNSPPTPRLGCATDVNKEKRRNNILVVLERSSGHLLGFRDLEKSFGFLQFHLFPDGQTPIILSGHLQAFLWDESHTHTYTHTIRGKHTTLYQQSHCSLHIVQGFKPHTSCSLVRNGQPLYTLMHQ